MVDPVTRRGVLNDWDLSYCSQLPQSAQPHGERTGTIPFMAVDLLCNSNWRGRKPRLYRHDLEGLIWILPWVFIQYEDSVFKEAKLKNWRTGDYSECGAAKKEMLEEPNMHEPMVSWKVQWPLAEVLLEWLQNECATRQLAYSETAHLTYSWIYRCFQFDTVLNAFTRLERTNPEFG